MAKYECCYRIYFENIFQIKLLENEDNVVTLTILITVKIVLECVQLVRHRLFYSISLTDCNFDVKKIVSLF